MLLKRIVASTLVGVLALSTVQTAFATDGNSISVGVNDIKIIAADTEADTIVAPGIEDLGVQLNDLYGEVGRSLNIDYMYVKMLHLIAGGKAVYADKRPNIYGELAVESLSAPFDIENAIQKYDVKAPWAICPDETVERPSKYYLPDAAYSVTSEVVKIMNRRYYADRGVMQEYFDELEKGVRTNVIFCEAVLEYIGSSQEAINSFYPAYEKMIYLKDRYENVLEANEDGTFSMKEKFKEILIANNISSEREINALSIILSFDSVLAASSNGTAVKSDFETPYIQNHTSRENMMLAAISIVGKVRYVWGGGHIGSGSIDGINPMWQVFFNQYGDEPGEAGYSDCIQPSRYWCPVHGSGSGGNACLMKSASSNSGLKYIEKRQDMSGLQDDELDKYADYLEANIDFKHGIADHRLDGLDCSGYASWVYNQISSNRVYDSGARAFISSGGLRTIPWGNQMLPGDVFSWGEHIVVNIGQVRAGSKVYVMSEASPNMVKFGVMYYGGAKQSDIDLAKKVAREANKLIGNLPDDEKTHVYNMENLGYIKDDAGNVTGRYAEIGRLRQSFIDENVVIPGYNKTIKDMTAQEIIQHTIDNLTIGYLAGAEDYEGEMFKLPEDILDKIEQYKLDQIEKVDTTEEEKTVIIVDTGVEVLINELSNTQAIIVEDGVDTNTDNISVAN